MRLINRTPGAPPLSNWLIVGAASVAGVVALIAGVAVATPNTPPPPRTVAQAPASPATPPPAPDPELWTVTRVVDGDTIDVAQDSLTERVRLVGIDTPEQGQCGAVEATEYLTELIPRSQQVRLVTTGVHRDDTDRYGRLIRYVRVNGDSDVGLTLISDGYAIARYDSRDGYAHHDLEESYVTADEASQPAVPCAQIAADKKAADEKAKADAKKAKAEKAAKKAKAEKKAKAAKAKKTKAKKKAAAAAEREREEQRAEEEREAEAEREQAANVYYENCDAVRAAGAAPITTGDPGYARHLDRDGDGVGCE